MFLSEADIKTVNDIKIQAMMFDMDIDWEMLQLIPKVKIETPFWIVRWQEKMTGGDQSVIDNGF